MNSLYLTGALVGALFALNPSCPAAASSAVAPWKVGTPVVTYWCGPSMTDATATQMAEGGFNLVWCGEKELDVAQRHGLRGQLTDGLLSPAALDDPAQREKLDAALATEMPQTAVMSLEILYRNAPKDKEIGLKLAEAWAVAGNKTKAENICEELRLVYPNDNEIFMALKNLSARKSLDEQGYGALASGTGSYRDILKDKDEAVRLEQENRQVKDTDTSRRLLDEYEARLVHDPKNLKLLRSIAELYTQRKEYGKAREAYQRIVSVEGQADAEFGHALGEASDLAAIGRPVVRRQLRTDGDRLPDRAKPSARRIGIDDMARAQGFQQGQVRQDGRKFVVDFSFENAPVVPAGHEFEPM